MQVQRAARDHDPAIAHARHDIFVRDLVGECDRRVARVGLSFAADRELAVQHDPLRGQLEVGVVRERELAVDGEPRERRRTHVEDHVPVSADGDLVTGDGQLVVGPCVGIGPARCLGRLGAGHLRSSSGKCRDEAEHGQNQERARLLKHGIDPQFGRDRRLSGEG